MQQVQVPSSIGSFIAFWLFWHTGKHGQSQQAHQHAWGTVARVRCRGGAAGAARSMLAGTWQQHKLAAPEVATATSVTDCSSVHAAVVATLPSVVIVGRCCIQWAEELQGNPAMFCGRQQEPCSGGKQQSLSEMAVFVYNFVDDAVATLQQWLAAQSTCTQLAAAGYAPQAMLQQLEQLLAAHKALQDSPSDTAAVMTVAQQLKSTGLALCSFAVPCICNNPDCTSMVGLSELASVSGRSCICAGCHGRACQRAVWKQHKPVCAALSAAAATAAGGGAGAGAGLVDAAAAHNT